jgi:hypothetical protein
MDKVPCKEDTKAPGKNLDLSHPWFQVCCKEETGEGYNIECLPIKTHIPRDYESVVKEGKTKNHDSVHEPDVSMVNLHPEKEYAAGDKGKTHKKVYGFDTITAYLFFVIKPFQIQKTGKKNHGYSEHLPQVYMDDFEQSAVIYTGNENDG